jgi:hypothetical protein
MQGRTQTGGYAAVPGSLAVQPFDMLLVWGAGQALPKTTEPVPWLRVPVSRRVCTRSQRTFMNTAV